MSQFYLKTATAAEPKPNATQDVGDTHDFGSYLTGLDCDLNAPVSATPSTRSQTFVAGTDDALHFSEAIGWLSFPLTGGSTGTGAFKTDVYADVSALPLSGQALLKASLYLWLANDTLSGQIGTTQSTGVLSTTITLYTLTFSASTSATYADGDRFYIEYWFETQDAVSLGDTGIYTYRVRYNDGTAPLADSSFTVPGTQTQLSTGRFLTLHGVGT